MAGAARRRRSVSESESESESESPESQEPDPRLRRRRRRGEGRGGEEEGEGLGGRPRNRRRPRTVAQPRPRRREDGGPRPAPRAGPRRPRPAGRVPAAARVPGLRAQLGGVRRPFRLHPQDSAHSRADRNLQGAAAAGESRAGLAAGRRAAGPLRGARGQRTERGRGSYPDGEAAAPPAPGSWPCAGARGAEGGLARRPPGAGAAGAGRQGCGVRAPRVVARRKVFNMAAEPLVLCVEAAAARAASPGAPPSGPGPPAPARTPGGPPGPGTRRGDGARRGHRGPGRADVLRGRERGVRGAAAQRLPGPRPESCTRRAVSAPKAEAAPRPDPERRPQRSPLPGWA